VDGLLLPDDSLLQALLHADELGHLGLHHARDGDARPAGHHVGHVLGLDFFLEHLVAVLDAGKRRLFLLQFLVELHEATVTDLGGLREIARTLGVELLVLQFFNLRLDGLDALDHLALVRPVLLLLVALGREGVDLSFELLQVLQGPGVCLVFQRLPLDLELQDPALQRVDLGGQAVQLDPQARGCLVDEIDRLVGQKPVADVAVRQGCRGHDSRVLDPHAVVHLVAFLEPAQDGDGVLHRGLLDQHGLESALQGRVLLDVLAVLVQGRRADAAQLAPGQGRLEHVRCVDGALGGPRSHDGVDLVDEEDDLALGGGHLLQDGLQAVFELAAELRARHERPHVQGDDALVLERLRHVAVDDPLREPLDDGRLADTRLADQAGVVLRAPREDLHDAPDLLVAADDGVEGSLLRQLVEIPCISFEGLVLLLGVLVRDPLASPDVHEGAVDGILRHAGSPEGLSGGAFLVFRHRDQDVLGADELVLETLCLLE